VLPQRRRQPRARRTAAFRHAPRRRAPFAGSRQTVSDGCSMSVDSP
jgi:hypothetical protein